MRKCKEGGPDRIQTFFQWKVAHAEYPDTLGNFEAQPKKGFVDES